MENTGAHLPYFKGFSIYTKDYSYQIKAAFAYLLIKKNHNVKMMHAVQLSYTSYCVIAYDDKWMKSWCVAKQQCFILLQCCCGGIYL